MVTELLNITTIKGNIIIIDICHGRFSFEVEDLFYSH